MARATLDAGGLDAFEERRDAVEEDSQGGPAGGGTPDLGGGARRGDGPLDAPVSGRQPIQRIESDGTREGAERTKEKMRTRHLPSRDAAAGSLSTAPSSSSGTRWASLRDASRKEVVAGRAAAGRGGGGGSEEMREGVDLASAMAMAVPCG